MEKESKLKRQEDYVEELIGILAEKTNNVPKTAKLKWKNITNEINMYEVTVGNYNIRFDITENEETIGIINTENKGNDYWFNLTKDKKEIISNLDRLKIALNKKEIIAEPEIRRIRCLENVIAAVKDY